MGLLGSVKKRPKREGSGRGKSRSGARLALIPMKFTEHHGAHSMIPFSRLNSEHLAKLSWMELANSIETPLERAQSSLGTP